MNKFRRIISMVMILLLFIGILPMNLGVVKAEEAREETAKLRNIKVRVYDGNSWTELPFDRPFDPSEVAYKINLDQVYNKIQLIIEKENDDDVVSATYHTTNYKFDSNNYGEAKSITADTLHFNLYVSRKTSTKRMQYIINNNSTLKHHEVRLDYGDRDYNDVYVGDTVTIRAEMGDSGKVFGKWIVKNGNVKIENPYGAITKFTMPDSDVHISASYKYAPGTSSKLNNIYIHALKDSVWKTFCVPIKPEEYEYEYDLSSEYSEVYLTLQEEDNLLPPYGKADHLNEHFDLSMNNNPISLNEYYKRFDTKVAELQNGENTFKLGLTSLDGKSKSEYTLKVNRGEVKYKVSFDPGEGSGTMKTEKIAKGSTYDLPDCTFIAPDGKMFKAWEVNGKEKKPGDKITINEKTIITATWKDIVFKVSLVPGEGTGETIVKEFVKGSTYELPKCDFVASENKEFAGWRIGNKEKKPGDVITINEDIEVIATWKDIMVNVSFKAGEGKGTMDAVKIAKGKELKLPECKFEAPDNKEFKAWSVNGKEKAVGEEITVNEDMEITALWQVKPIENVKVTLVANNGTNETKKENIKKGTEYTLPDCKFTVPEGQVFKAWQIADKEYNPQSTIIIDSETIITAIWQAKPNPEKPNETHTIKITTSPYGEVTIDPLEAKAGDKVTVRVIAKYGYELVSLSVRDASGKLLPIINGQFIMPDSEVKIYPVFREIAPYIEPEIDKRAEREEQKRKHRRNYYHEEEKDEDEVKTIDKTKEEKQKESKVLITIGSEMLDKVDNGVRTLKAMDAKPYIKCGRTMLPLRYVAEALGYRVAWLSETRTAVIMDIGLRVEIPVDSSFIIVNGVKYTSDVKPEMRNNRIMLPIANIARALGLKDGKDILWDEVNRQVTLIRNFNTK